MKKAVFQSIMALAVVLGLTLAMAVPVVAQPEEEGVDGGKSAVWEVTDGHPEGVYLVCQSVLYELYLNNYEEISADVAWIQDTFGLGTAGEYTQWWDDFEEEWVSSDPVDPFSIPAGGNWTEQVVHTIRENHLIDHPSIQGAKAVRNRIRAFAEQGLEEYNIDQTYTVRVIQPEIHISKSVTPSVAQVGQTVMYTFTITNTGNWPLEDITLIDDKLGDLTGELPANLVLGPGDDHVVGPIPYTIQAGDLPLVNTATVEGAAEDFDAAIFPYAEPDAELPTAVVRDTDTSTVRSVPPVGGTASPVSRLALLAPWIVLAGLIAGAAVFLWSRRAQGRA